MAKILDVIQGLAQAAANSYDGALDEDGNPIEIGLRREDKNMFKKNMADGFRVRETNDCELSLRGAPERRPPSQPV